LEVLDLFVGIFETFGLPKSMAQIYGVLYCGEEPMLQEEIVQRLGISTGSASQGLRVLSSLGAVHRQSRVGQRQSVYLPERSVRRLLAYFIDAQLRPKLNSGRERLESIADRLPDDDKNAREKVDNLLTWQRKADRALPLITGLLGK
jgi:DNA-binding transcriptional regulator GbsR (MarR family)